MNWAFAQLLERLELTDDERRHLADSTPHALRHTFGTQAIAANVPPDVAQKVLGHASLATTSIYAQAETKRVRRELAGYFAQMPALGAPTARPTAAPVAADILAMQQDIVIGEPFWSLDTAVPDPVPNDDEQVAQVRVTLQVQATDAPNTTQTERARDALERWILAFSGTERAAPSVVMLLLPYRQVGELDTRVRNWLDDIASEAQEGGFACALDARWGERRWTHTGAPTVGRRCARSTPPPTRRRLS
ncbi:tyrosine-type recombinase/integrase [Burkholderia sp. AU45388]|uniref:tyrosine-type recombinase/integrase n=1 Tax=Burkholderia sp. AU45388 TaxID=3059206 RepID=UPI003463480D